MDNNIDYILLAEAQSYYSGLGYRYIDLPWTVDEIYSNATKPIEYKNFYIDNKVLVASGEQSFIELAVNNKLVPGKYFGITPCFRDERIDRIHNKYFMKLELFQNDVTDIIELGFMIEDVQKFFSELSVDTIKTITPDGFDITTINNIELGSYGIREVLGIKYIYGTGLALPRFTNALNI